MRESKQNAGVRELLAYLEAENSMLRDRALKLASEIRALREALGGDVLSEKRPIGAELMREVPRLQVNTGHRVISTAKAHDEHI
jgi:hypothetical protein